MKNMNEITNFIKSNKLCVLVVTNSSCGVCLPVVSKIELLLQELPHIPYKKITLDDIPEFSGAYSVFSVPTLILFFNGKEVLRQSVFFNFYQLKTDLMLWVENFSCLDEDPFVAFYD